MTYKGIKIAEGEFDGIAEFATEAELKAYSDGYSEGADEYSGSACVYTAKDLPDLEEKDGWIANERIAALVRKHCL